MPGKCTILFPHGTYNFQASGNGCQKCKDAVMPVCMNIMFTSTYFSFCDNFENSFTFWQNNVHRYALFIRVK